TDEEIAKKLGVSVEELEESLSEIARSSIAALDELWTVGSGGDAVALIDTIEDEGAPDPQGTLSVTEQKEALADAIARLPEREQRRGMSLSGSLCHLEWKDRKINLVDTPGDAGFQADTYAALRVVEGVVVVLSGVMGVEVNTSRVWKRAEDLELSRVLFVNMLDRERADFLRVLEAARQQLSDRCVAIQLPIGSEHELTGIVDLLHMCAYLDPSGSR